MKANVPKNGQIKIKDDKAYVFQGNEYVEVEGTLSNAGALDTGLTIYEVNKQLVMQLPDMTEEQVFDKETIIKQYINNQKAIYYMLLCNDLRYYTVFQSIKTDNPCLYPVWTEAITCIQEFADSIKSIELTEDKSAVEIWIQQNNNIYAMYLFNYDSGVIICDR